MVGRSLETRRDAAMKLASLQGADGWKVLLVMRTPQSERAVPDERLLRQIDRSVLAAFIECLGPDTAKVVLLGVTQKLSDMEVGRWSRRRWGRFEEVETRPVCDLAQDALRRATGLDHGYDYKAWQEAILYSQTAATVRKRRRRK